MGFTYRLFQIMAIVPWGALDWRGIFVQFVGLAGIMWCGRREFGAWLPWRW